MRQEEEKWREEPQEQRGEGRAGRRLGETLVNNEDSVRGDGAQSNAAGEQR